MTRLGRRIEMRGVVQGVGVRPWIYRLASEQGLAGYVRNDAAGVTIEAFGSEEALDAFLHRLEHSAPPAADISELRASPIPVAAFDLFSIVHSEESSERRISIPPDLPTCPDCLAELFDPSDRRYRYPFINCTNCGPRFTIARDAPYDRSMTTMAAFEMCAACQHEYDDVGDRRFHAQPNACPACGPQLELRRPDGARLGEDDPIGAVAAALRAGRIVAVKGLGGFHLACDAASADAVRELRTRKRRDEKPFAVMVKDLEAAERVAVLSPEEQRMLQSIEHPIVLATRRDDCGLASDVAPRNPWVGVMLPYTPLHHLLMRAVDGPVVMTSGNLSDEPIVRRNEDAAARLGGIADLFLVHDREIETSCDDSVARIIGRRPVVLRRARGYAPRPVLVNHSSGRPGAAFDRPVLACGALLKNTFCIGTGDAAYLGPHIGDLENLDAFESYEASVARMERFLRVAPEIIAYDLHPEYLSTRYALARPEALKIGVQHHHAHAASAMAEHHLPGPVIGVAYDGVGYGLDGAAWGGEVLIAQYDSFERLATLRPIPLPGGDAAVRQPWRIALALVEDAFDGQAPLDDMRLFSSVTAQRLSVARQMLGARIRCPLAHGCGRYFDGVGSLVLSRPESRYEGQIALEWNAAADPAEPGCYDYVVNWAASPWTIDLRPMMRAIIGDLRTDARASQISARFHNTLVAATADVVRAAAKERGPMPVVLTGGCFQNARLSESLAAALGSQLDVHLHRDVPPGDGGIALGQAVVAAAVARLRAA